MEGSLKTVSDDRLLRGLDALVTRTRQNEAELLAYLAEVDKRKLYLAQSYSCMFLYCTEALHFSEASAYRRIAIARAARVHPLLLERIREGAIHLAGAKLLAPHLTQENRVELLDLARHKSKRAIEVLLADRAPRPDVPARVRQLPERRPASAVRMRPAIAESKHEAPRQEAAPSPPVPRAPNPAPSPLGGKRF